MGKPSSAGPTPRPKAGAQASPAWPGTSSAGAKPAIASGNGPGGTPSNVRGQLAMQRPVRSQANGTLVTARQRRRGLRVAAPNVVDQRDAIGLGFGHSAS